MSKTVDPRVLKRLRADLGAEAAEQIVDQFLTDARRCVREIHDALASGDRETAGRAAHSLRSTAALVGAVELSAACMALERAAPDRAPATLRRAAKRVAAALQDAAAALGVVS